MEEAKLPYCCEKNWRETLSAFILAMIALVFTVMVISIPLVITPQHQGLLNRLEVSLPVLTLVVLSPWWFFIGLATLLIPMAVSLYMRKKKVALFFILTTVFLVVTTIGLMLPIFDFIEVASAGTF